MRGGKGDYPCSPDMKKVYKEDRWKRYWNRLTEEELSYFLCKGEPVTDWSCLDFVHNQLNERTRLLQNSVLYNIEVPVIKLCQLSPLANLIMEIIKMVKSENQFKGGKKTLQKKNNDAYLLQQDYLRYKYA